MAKSKLQKGQQNELGIDPRNLSVEQRRELFLKKKKELSKDWRVIQEGQVDELVPFNLLTLDFGLRLEGLARSGCVYSLHGDEGGGHPALQGLGQCHHASRYEGPTLQSGHCFRRSDRQGDP